MGFAFYSMEESMRNSSLSIHCKETDWNKNKCYTAKKMVKIR